MITQPHSKTRANQQRQLGRRLRRRRGVLLLIVLSLLVLFLLVGLSFLVSAGQFNRIARSAQQTESTGMDGHKLADNVMYQLLRGTDNPYSSLQGHSLLEDLYGRDYLLGTAQSVADDFGSNSQQVQRITFDPTNTTPGEQTQFSKNGKLQSLNDDYYAGCVLTFVSGNAKGQSTRVVGYKPTNRALLIKGVTPVPNANSRFVINGRPFNGTGAGYNQTLGQLSESVTIGGQDVPIALLPHYRAYQHNTALLPFFVGSQAYNVGGMDEDYDSVDYQNMFMSKPADRGAYQFAVNGTASTNPEAQNLVRFYASCGGAIPSFHRPYLMQHMAVNNSAAFADPNVRRAISLRPVGREMMTGGTPTGDHPAFTGSNPRFDPILGPWDVDNDGDGIAESIWIHAGLSPVSGPDGRMYQPLVAIHVADLDGRININAVDGLQRTMRDLNFQTGAAVTRTGGVQTALTLKKTDLGLGYGPADITSGLFENVIRARSQGNAYDGSGNLLEVKPTSGVTTLSPWEEYTGVGRREMDDDGDANINENRRLMTLPNTTNQNPALGYAFRLDLAQAIKTGYGSPPDLHARAVPYLDPHGNMVWSGHFLGAAEGVEDPYEANLVQRSPFDNLYDLKDMMSILAVNPRDYRIVSEKKTLKTNSEELDVARGLNPSFEVTTRSFSIPAIPAVGVGRYRGTNASGDALPRTLREMFAAKMIRYGVNPANAFDLVETWDLMAPELARGEKIDINRVLFPNQFDGTFNNIQEQELLVAKERFARHLFNLMMLLCDEPDSGVPGLPALAAREAHVRRIAQWAINVVDFGDADSVMTRFRYDVNPFNNEPVRFRANGQPFPSAQNSVDYREIWGMEHPEMLLSETLAMHDRRVQDTDEDPNGDFVNDGDPHFDSVTQPEGSLFVELICMRGQNPSTGNVPTWVNHHSKGTEDLYPALASGIPGGILDLDAHLPGSLKPVWRIAVSEPHPSSIRTPRELFEEATGTPADRHQLGSQQLRSFEPKKHLAGLATSVTDLPSPFWNPGTPDPLLSLNLELDRFIWFSPNTPPMTGQEETEANTYVYTPEGTLTPLMPEVRPGDYVLVGPRLRTHIGLDDNLDELDQTIDLQRAPRGDGGRPIQRRQNLSRDQFGSEGRVVPVVARTTGSAEAGVSVSEPLDNTDYYPDLPARGATTPNRAAEYSPPWDEPLDLSVGPMQNLDHDTTTHEDYRTVFLQRLANPRLPWNNDPNDPLFNPYRTIDWMPVDLSVFNSLNFNSQVSTVNDPDDPGTPRIADLFNGVDGVRFSSLEKTGYPDRDNVQIWQGLGSLIAEPSGPAGNPLPAVLINHGYGLFNIWSGWTSPPRRNVDPTLDGPVRNTAGSSTHVDDTTFVHSLGWLNRSFADFVPDLAGVINSGVNYYLPLGDPYAEAPRPQAINGVQYTFPSFVWHNRPYANAMELMLVPASASSRLSAEFTTSIGEGRPTGSPVNLGSAVDNLPATGADGALREYRGAFGHLLNFFHSSTGTKGEAADAPSGIMPSNFHRILDFVHVPSRFMGTETWLTRTQMQPDSPYYIDPSDPVAQEINKPTISEFREPGKVNLNTFHPEYNGERNNLTKTREIAEYLGFNSTIADSTPQSDPWLLFQTSLAGNDPLVVDDPVASGGTGLFGRYPNGNHPAEYPNPLRASANADLKATLVSPSRTPLATDASMLRSIPVTTGGVTNEIPAVAPFDRPSPNDLGESLQNPKTNAYFRYKDLMKLGNSVTSQSNVFAVWITVGYFEILPNMNAPAYTTVEGIDASHPDGFQLGIEMGSDVGQITRHRSFYIIDRSIPVAFEPGKNHNVDEAVLIRRRLE